MRFAVVLYAGASLAIYINGVVQELFHLVRATASHPEDQSRAVTLVIIAVVVLAVIGGLHVGETWDATVEWDGRILIFSTQTARRYVCNTSTHMLFYSSASSAPLAEKERYRLTTDPS